MIKTIAQPIINLITGEKVLEERLCRPDQPINKYFSTKDRNTLLRRELHSVFQCIEDSNGYPCNINITMYSMQTLARLPVSWNGGIEIVEWDKNVYPNIYKIAKTVKIFQSKGLMVWADDVKEDALDIWLKAGVNGFKVDVPLLIENEDFVKRLFESKKPVIVERIETKEEDMFVRKNGFYLAQGFYYGASEELRSQKHLEEENAQEAISNICK